MIRNWKRLGASVALATGVTVGGLIIGATTASASYGPGTAYQVEISGNANNLSFIPGAKANGSGGGFWFWAALTPTSATGGSVDYQETDCVHNISPNPNGAVHFGGETTYTLNSNGTLTILGVMTGVGPQNLTVPSTYGHYGASDVNLGFFNVLTNIQAQVAP